jgi:hypothetical protein
LDLSQFAAEMMDLSANVDADHAERQEIEIDVEVEEQPVEQRTRQRSAPSTP